MALFEEISIVLIFCFFLMLLVFSMVFLYIFHEKIINYCVYYKKQINNFVKNKRDIGSPDERINLIEEDLEGFELV